MSEPISSDESVQFDGSCVSAFEEASSEEAGTPTAKAVTPRAGGGGGADLPPLTVVISLFSPTLRSVVVRALTDSGRFAVVSAIAPPPRPHLPPPKAASGGPYAAETKGNEGGSGSPSDKPPTTSLESDDAAAAFVAAVEGAFREEPRLALLVDAAVLQLLSRAVRSNPPLLPAAGTGLRKREQQEE